MLAEKLWSASVSSLLALLDNSPNGIFICTKEKYLVYVNKAYEQINGLNASDIVGKTLYELVSMGYIETSIGLLVIESKQPTSIIQRLPKINKELLVTANPVFDANNELDLIVGISMDLNKLSQEKWELWRNKNAFSELPHEDTVIAQSAIMRNTLNLTYRAAQSKVSILFLGESGVGKDVLARYTHENGPFRKGPMVSINCAALPSELLESELYGYVKGAFTGAKSDGKPGLFELASGGTLFLDEVGDLPLTLQPKLLRILEERKMRRLGGTKMVPVDFRLIAATNQDLEEKIAAGAFRKDLFFRLSVLPIRIPPLRERPEDIVAIANYFLAKLNAEYRVLKSLSPRSIQLLKSLPWPGNVRELKNCIERTMILSDAESIEPEDLMMSEVPADSGNTESVTGSNEVEEFEKQLILKAHKKHQSTRKAANELGMSQSRFMRKLKKYRDCPS